MFPSDIVEVMPSKVSEISIIWMTVMKYVYLITVDHWYFPIVLATIPSSFLWLWHYQGQNVWRRILYQILDITIYFGLKHHLKDIICRNKHTVHQNCYQLYYCPLKNLLYLIFGLTHITQSQVFCILLSGLLLFYNCLSCHWYITCNASKEKYIEKWRPIITTNL